MQDGGAGFPSMAPLQLVIPKGAMLKREHEGIKKHLYEGGAGFLPSTVRLFGVSVGRMQMHTGMADFFMFSVSGTLSACSSIKALQLRPRGKTVLQSKLSKAALALRNALAMPLVLKMLAEAIHFRASQEHRVL